MEKATFAAGCFWGVEAAFRKMPGVTSAQAGYTGGSTDHPTYGEVCSGTTGHAEAVELEYDPNQVTYEALLNLFWEEHDPTVPHPQRSGAKDQYRSAIFCHTPEQKAAALASKERLEDSGRYKRAIATEIAPAPPFHRAEERHQRYFEKHR